MSIGSLLLLIFILGIIILVHELGHFLWAKKFDVHIYEFSLGMGPVLFSKLGKDNIKYNIRAIPIGGFVSMAGEVLDDDDENKIDKSRLMCNKKWYQRLIILVAGVVNNFILAIIVLFTMGLIWGGSLITTNVEKVMKDYPFHAAGVQKGDKITKINGIKVKSWDTAQLVLHMKNKNKHYIFEIMDKEGNKKVHKITPIKEKNEEGEKVLTFGIGLEIKNMKGFKSSFKYSFKKLFDVLDSMNLTIYGLITGKIGVKSLAGPVGMYKVVDSTKVYGIANILYLIAFLSINVGFINILPFPAFDGGRILFLIIEKVRRKPIDPKLENIFHIVGFILLMILMIYVSINDIIRLF